MGRMKRYTFNIASTKATVEAEPDGESRYMVRMSIPDITGRVRIGYLTGNRRTWLAEHFGGKRPSVPATTAKAACRALAEAAVPQVLSQRVGR